MKTYLYKVSITVNTITENSFIKITTLFTISVQLQDVLISFCQSIACRSYSVRYRINII